MVPGCEGLSTMVKSPTYAVLSRNQLCRKVRRTRAVRGGGVTIPPKNDDVIYEQFLKPTNIAIWGFSELLTSITSVKSQSVLETPGPIDRTPCTHGSDNKEMKDMSWMVYARPNKQANGGYEFTPGRHG